MPSAVFSQVHGLCLFTSSVDGHQANWAFEVASIAIPPSFGGLCHGSGVWDQGCPSPAHVCVCVPVRVQKSKKRQAPGRCLLHILIRLASFSFLLGAQALTTSAAAARCQRLPAPVHQLPFPSQQVSCGPPPRSAVCSVPETGMRSGLSSPSARWTCQSDERTDSLG